MISQAHIILNDVSPERVLNWKEYKIKMIKGLNINEI